ncbi:MAG: FAD-dependent monooxygenase [Caldimonas sp.]
MSGSATPGGTPGADVPGATATQCCIVGGGPAGMMLGYLLARAGVRVVVLEKHADLLRDFRGDSVHPSTLRIMDELGPLDDELPVPLPLRVLTAVPPLQRLFARVLGMGVRPEHVRSPVA